MDRRVTEILVGEGMSGKTAELIKRSAESGIYILVANRKRAEILAEQARDMKLYIPFPVTLQEWLRSENRFHGSSIRRDGLLIDDIDDVIKELFLPIEIKAVTLRTPRNVRNLDKENSSANDEQSEGEWVVKWKSTFPQYEPSEYECSVCKYRSTVLHKYCQNCGAKMKGSAE